MDLINLAGATSNHPGEDLRHLLNLVILVNHNDFKVLHFLLNIGYPISKFSHFLSHLLEGFIQQTLQDPIDMKRLSVQGHPTPSIARVGNFFC